MDELETAKRLIGRYKSKRWKKLIKKVENAKDINLEHINYAAIGEALRILSKPKVRYGTYKDIGWLYYKSYEGIKVQTSLRYYRILSVYGHGHSLVHVNLESMHDVNRFLLKASMLLGKRPYKHKDGGYYVYFGKR